jgi:hypothetical protein
MLVTVDRDLMNGVIGGGQYDSITPDWLRPLLLQAKQQQQGNPYRPGNEIKRPPSLTPQSQ